MIVAAATLFELLSTARRQHKADSQLRQIRDSLDQQLTETRIPARTLRRVRGAVKQMLQYLDPAPKRVKKPAS